MKIGKTPANRVVEHIVGLCSIPSPSGFTAEISTHICETFQAMGFSPLRTRKGSVLVDLSGNGEPLALAAHEAGV